MQFAPLFTTLLIIIESWDIKCKNILVTDEQKKSFRLRKLFFMEKLLFFSFNLGDGSSGRCGGRAGKTAEAYA